MFRAKRIPGFIHFERLKHALDTRSQGGGHRLLLELRLHGQHARVPTTLRPRFSEPQHYEHYAFSQRAAIAERSPQLPRGCARSREPLPTLYLASEANVISLVEV
jgi:hypothetical protein